VLKAGIDTLKKMESDSVRDGSKTRFGERAALRRRALTCWGS